MPTGRTPFLDSLRADGYLRLYYDFRSNSLYDFGVEGNSLLSSSSGRSCLYNGGLITSTTAYEITYSKSTTVRIQGGEGWTVIDKVMPIALPGASGDFSTSFIVYGAPTRGFCIYCDKDAFVLTSVQYYLNGTNVQVYFPATLQHTRNPIVVGYSIYNKRISLYTNGSFVGTSPQNSQTDSSDYLTRSAGFTFYSARAPAKRYYFLSISRNLSADEHLTLYQELEGRTWEMSPLVINKDYPTIGSSVWEARFGLIADERTMSAGQSIGQLDQLRVVSGTHKATTVAYGSTVAKCIECVTNGTVRLPDPRPNLGTTFAFKRFSGGSWSDVTSTSRDIALTAGQRILWATMDGTTCLRKY